MQPQAAAHVAATSPGDVLVAGMAELFIEVAPGNEVFRVADIALKAAGSAIGWGFQLQSPPVVATLALLMLAVALNLSGLFEVGTSLQGAGSGLAARGGMAGAFFTGVLSVVVAAPCTAPFMGPALGWALTQPAVAALVVFAALGVGFAAPSDEARPAAAAAQFLLQVRHERHRPAGEIEDAGQRRTQRV